MNIQKRKKRAKLKVKHLRVAKPKEKAMMKKEQFLKQQQKIKEIKEQQIMKEENKKPFLKSLFS